MSTESPALTLSLISHTNVGKTTLARTLLDQDVGDVRDRAHVTIAAAEYTMLALPGGETLKLWDTPGFGDSVRLARRLAQQGNPIGWFLGQVWDRLRDRPLWLAQQAVRNVRDRADVVLYLVNASEDPAHVGYIAPELQVLAWIGKPVIALLNQTGPPRAPHEEDADAMSWRQLFAQHPFVTALLPLDAFARCWVQEITLLRAVIAAVPAEQRALAERVSEAWQQRRLVQFRESMQVLARPIARAACEQITLPTEPPAGALRRIAKAIGADREGADARAGAVQESAQRVARDLRDSTDELIRVHRLHGSAAEEVLARLAGDVTIQEPVDETKAAMVGGVVSGALSGLAADLALGGLTLGAGMLTGGLLGALGGAGVARGYNVVRGTTETKCRWSESFLDGLVRGALLRYLAVAHYGRGRGEWTASQHPEFWRDVVDRTVATRHTNFAQVWNESSEKAVEVIEAQLCDLLQSAAREVLQELYPGVLARDA